MPAAAARLRGRAPEIACATLAFLHAALWLDTGPLDDGDIAHRCARNLVLGNGLVFDPGELVEGFTVPL